MMRKNKSKVITLLIASVVTTLTICEPLSVMATPNEDVKEKAAGIYSSVSTGTQNDLWEDKNQKDDDEYEYEGARADGVKDEDIEINDDGDIEEKIIAWEEVHISSSEELLDFAKNCTLDTWSQNKNVFLDSDISMTNIEFQGIPTFGGCFDGKGHTISGLNVSSDRSYLGFFSRIQSEGVVKDLNISARVTPHGAQTIIGGIAGDNNGIIANCSFKGSVSGENYVGGIVGINELSGIILDSSSDGVISGTHFTGGIAGENMGNIMRCTNKAGVNIANKSTAMTIDDISIDSVLAMIGIGDSDKDEAEASAMINGVVDMGGIAGVSVGVIQFCTNEGTVGYTNVGYNAGGIAGRQSGYIYSCTNNGEVLGRKDVGGIVGQAEPYVTIDFANDITSQLSDNIEKLHDILEVTLNDADNSSDTISNRLSIIKNFTDLALDDTRYIENETIDWANGMVSSANEAISRIDFILEQSAKKDGVMDKASDAASDAREAMGRFETTIKDLDLEKYMSSSQKDEYEAAKKNIEDATKEFEEYEKEINKNAAYNYSLHYYLNQAEYRDATPKDEKDVVFKDSDGNYKFDYNGSHPGASSSPANAPKAKGSSLSVADVQDGGAYDISGSWVHADEGDASLGSSADADQNKIDGKLAESAAKGATELIKAYADKKYDNNHSALPGQYAKDLKDNGEKMAAIIANVSGDMTDATRSDATKAISSLESSMDNLKEAGDKAKSIIKTINDKGDITLPSFSQEYKAHANSLTNNIQGMSDNFGLLNSEMNGASDVLIHNLKGVNDQFNVIMQLFTDAVDGVLDNDYSNTFNDGSLEVCESTTDATIASCINNGLVKGSIDVAGIAGTMAIEYDFDLESDVTGFKNAAMNTTYQTKCVLRKNVNRAEVKAIKNYVGGICGTQEMGTITGCENYDRISSETGSYVGGIAGSSVSNIVKSYAKCALSGNSYVGGIAGDGIKIYECLTMVKVDDASEWYGAIAGHVSDTDKVRNNYFFGSDLAGIDRVSYSGCAESISYSYAREMLGNIPSDFSKMIVSFAYIDEDENGNEVTKLIEKRLFDYGQILKLEDYPKVPEKDGYYAKWDVEAKDSVVNDETVTATYVRNNTTLASEIVRGSNQSALLVDGAFKQEDSLWAVLSVAQPDSMENCQEYWDVTIPEDGQAEHQIRFMKADNMDKWPEIYVKENNASWRKITKDDFSEMGAYKTFPVSGNDVKIQVIYSDAKAKMIKKILFIVAIVVCWIVIVSVIIVILRSRSRVHKRVQKRAQAIREKNAQREPAIKFVEEEEITDGGSADDERH